MQNEFKTVYLLLQNFHWKIATMINEINLVSSHQIPAVSEEKLSLLFFCNSEELAIAP